MSRDTKKRPRERQAALLIGHVNGRQLTGAIEPGQLIGIPAVGLHAVGRLPGDEGGRDDLAMNAPAAQVAAQDKAARPGFVNQVQLEVVLGEFF